MLRVKLAKNTPNYATLTHCEVLSMPRLVLLRISIQSRFYHTVFPCYSQPRKAVRKNKIRLDFVYCNWRGKAKPIAFYSMTATEQLEQSHQCNQSVSEPNPVKQSHNPEPGPVNIQSVENLTQSGRFITPSVLTITQSDRYINQSVQNLTDSGRFINILKAVETFFILPF